MATKKKAGKKKPKKKAKRKTAGRGTGAGKKAVRKKAGAAAAAPPPPERGTGSPPGPGSERGAPDERVKLEDFLVACQKSLARSAHAAEHASRAESEFAHGDRNLFMIDGLDLDLSAGLSMSFKADGEDPGKSRPHAVMLDFAAAEAERSRLRFRVETKPLELLEGAHLQLANLDPLGDALPDAHLRVWLVDARGEEVPGHEVGLQFMPAGTRDPGRLTTLKLTTDMAGRVNFWLRPRGDTLVVEVVGDQAYRRRVLRDDVEEYLLWIECEMRDEAGRPITLKTEVLRLPAR